MSNIGENIKNFRTFRGISQESLANKLGKTKSVISNWERGANAPDPDSIELLCKLLDVTPSQIFGWDKNPEYEQRIKAIKKYQKQIDELTIQKENIEAEIFQLQTLMDMEINPVFDDD